MSYDWRTIERGEHKDELCYECENSCWSDQLCWCCCLLAAVTELRAVEDRYANLMKASAELVQRNIALQAQLERLKAENTELRKALDPPF